jgi:hypothetical protein
LPILHPYGCPAGSKRDDATESGRKSDATPNLILKHPNAMVATYVKVVETLILMKNLKNTPEIHLKTIATICNIRIKHMQTDVWNICNIQINTNATCIRKT